jgi:hypothetical protein
MINKRYMKKYKSKIGFWIVLFILVVLGYTSTIMIIHKVWIGFVLNLLLLGFISYLLNSINYIINNNDLIINCGFLYKKTISINTIKKIKETHNILSSPAASLDRIAIYYNKKDLIMISPKYKDDFINKLTEINSKIEVIMKKNKK